MGPAANQPPGFLLWIRPASLYYPAELDQIDPSVADLHAPDERVFSPQGRCQVALGKPGGLAEFPKSLTQPIVLRGEGRLFHARKMQPRGVCPQNASIVDFE